MHQDVIGSRGSTTTVSALTTSTQRHQQPGQQGRSWQQPRLRLLHRAASDAAPLRHPFPPDPQWPKPPSSSNQPPHDPNDLIGPAGYGFGGIPHPGWNARLHDRILQREDRPGPRGQRRRHRAAQPEPRLEHVPARHDRVRQLRRQRAAGLDVVQHAGRCHGHARRLRRHRREPEPEHRPAHGHVHVARPDDARHARPTRSSASCRPTRIRPTARATSTTRSSPRRASPPARRSTPRRASSSTPTRPSPRRRSPTRSTPRPPTSTVTALPSTTTTPSFIVSWSGIRRRRLGHRRLQRLCLRRRRRFHPVPGQHHRVPRPRSLASSAIPAL